MMRFDGEIEQFNSINIFKKNLLATARDAIATANDRRSLDSFVRTTTSRKTHAFLRDRGVMEDLGPPTIRFRI